MGTPFSDVYKRFLQKISDFKFLSLPEEDAVWLSYQCNRKDKAL